jgi:hypothetical protein
MYSKLIILAAVIGLMVCIVPSQSYAVCDISNSRVVNVEMLADSTSGTLTRYYLADGSNPLPGVYYFFDTSNAIYINHLNAAHAGNLQVRVRGNAAACPGAGALRNGGTILRVFRSTFF